ncbi:MAG: hypothetical protein AAFZ92_04945 [Pseudomonadota bacterium]
MIISDNSSALSERRRSRRYRLSSEIHVIDQWRNENLGKLVNIHQQGLLIVGTCLSVSSSHQITLFLPNSINQHRRFDLGIECLWHEKTSDESALYWCGCSIIDKSSQADACIQALINIQS